MISGRTVASAAITRATFGHLRPWSWRLGPHSVKEVVLARGLYGAADFVDSPVPELPLLQRETCRGGRPGHEKFAVRTGGIGSAPPGPRSTCDSIALRGLSRA